MHLTGVRSTPRVAPSCRRSARSAASRPSFLTHLMRTLSHPKSAPNFHSGCRHRVRGPMPPHTSPLAPARKRPIWQFCAAAPLRRAIGDPRRLQPPAVCGHLHQHGPARSIPMTSQPRRDGRVGTFSTRLERRPTSSSDQTSGYNAMTCVTLASAPALCTYSA